LFVRKAKGKELLMDYNQSHVVTSIEYFKILEGKTVNKEATKEVRHQK